MHERFTTTLGADNTKEAKVKQTVSQIISSAKEMYRLPNDSPLSEKDIERYSVSRDRFSIMHDAQMLEHDLQSSLYRNALQAAFLLLDLHPSSAETYRADFLLLATEALQKGDIAGLSLANALPERDRTDVFHQAIASGNLSLQRVVAMSLQGLSPEAHANVLQELCVQFDKRIKGFPILSEFEDIFLLTPHLPEAQRRNAILYMRDTVAYELERENYFLTARELVPFFPMPERGELEEILRLNAANDIFSETLPPQAAEGQERNKYTIASSQKLYATAPKNFFRSSFLKNGSETTLLGKTLQRKAILRTIDHLAYLGWRTAYEAVNFWKQSGFSYVPIEPIVSIREDKNPHNINVFARVLPGPNVLTWLQETSGKHREHILRQVHAITENLERLGVVFAQVNESHLHLRNFVLIFERDSENNPILEKPPRVYLIDFDQSAPLFLPKTNAAR